MTTPSTTPAAEATSTPVAATPTLDSVRAQIGGLISYLVSVVGIMSGSTKRVNGSAGYALEMQGMLLPRAERTEGATLTPLTAELLAEIAGDSAPTVQGEDSTPESGAASVISLASQIQTRSDQKSAASTSVEALDDAGRIALVSTYFANRADSTTPTDVSVVDQVRASKLVTRVTKSAGPLELEFSKVVRTAAKAGDETAQAVLDAATAVRKERLAK